MNPEHIEIVMAGAKAIEQWRDENQHKTLALTRADLRIADLRSAALAGAKL